MSWQEKVKLANDNILKQDICEPARQAGVELDDMGISLSHTIHDITVEDIRYFFDASFPVENSIPSCNTNLTSKGRKSIQSIDQKRQRKKSLPAKLYKYKNNSKNILY